VASLALTLVVSALAAFSVLPWWSSLVVVAILAADVAWLRVVARSERAKILDSETAHGPATSPTGTSLSRSVGRHHAASEYEYESGSEAGSEAPLAARDEVAQPSAELTGGTGTAAEADPAGWAPVPVPPPTYTLKAKAAPPVPVAELAVDTEPGTGQSWSLDGLVYDCDLDELVERRRAVGG